MPTTRSSRTPATADLRAVLAPRIRKPRPTARAKPVAPKRKTHPAPPALPPLCAAAVPTPSLVPGSPITPPSSPSITPAPSATPSPRPPIARHHHHAKLVSLISASLSRVCTPSSPSSAIYVCGTPGTGKTLTVRSALQAISHSSAHFAPSFPSIFLNCATLSSPTHLLSMLCTQLSLPTTSDPAAALRAFATSPGPVAVAVLDELDLLLPSSGASRGNALYSIFELAALPASRLCIIAIANALDLPQRRLPFLQSPPIILPFAPYLADELIQIVDGASELPRPAVLLAAKKVAAGSGDARLMLDVLARARAEQTRGDARSAMKLVATTAGGRGSAAQIVDVVNALPVQQMLALVVAANAVSFGKKGANVKRRATLGGLHESFARMCERVHVPALDFSEFADVCCGPLKQMALVDVVKGRGKNTGGTMRTWGVRLKVAVEDVRAGIENKGFLSKVLAE